MTFMSFTNALPMLIPLNTILNYTMKIILLILSFAMFSNISFADENSKAKAKELMALMKIKENIEKSLAEISKFSDGMIDAQNLSDEEKKKAKELTKSSTEAVFKGMLKLDWEGMFAEIYSEVFTTEDLQGLIDFYKTPVGQKFIDKQLDLQKATMGRMQIEMGKVMPEVQKAIQKSIEDAKKAE